MYPVERQKQALSQLSTTLKAVISQRLLPRSDRPGRIGAFEIMFVNSAIANLIREDKIPQIEQMISLNQQTGMITRKLSIENLLKEDLFQKKLPTSTVTMWLITQYLQAATILRSRVHREYHSKHRSS